MFDVILESIRAFILFGLILFLFKQERSAKFNVSTGWRFIVYGFGLLLFGSILDITDNFDELNKFIVIGDTETEALLEKLVGFLGGFVLLAFGLIKWIPNYLAERETSEEFFQKAFHSSPTALAVSDPHSGAYFDVNKAWSEITGYSHEEALKNSVWELGIWVNPGDRTKLLESLNQTQSVSGIDTTFRSKSGEFRDMLVAGEIIEVRGEKRVMLIGQDITKFKEIERLKTEFVSIVSHELRTPLTSIKGALGLVLGGAGGDLTDATEELIQLASRNCNRLSNLVDDILDFEKLKSSAMNFNFETVDLSALVKESLEQCAPYAQEFKVSFVLKDSVDHLKVWGDAGRLNQVMVNLLSNAAKFSTVDGEVEISISDVAGKVKVAITDHGVGIKENFRNSVFDTFTQEDSSDTRSIPGTGLGLSITKFIIEKHDGNIDYISTPNIGTTFHFELPAFQSAAE